MLLCIIMFQKKFRITSLLLREVIGPGHFCGRCQNCVMGSAVIELCGHKYQLMLSCLVIADKWPTFPRGLTKLSFL